MFGNLLPKAIYPDKVNYHLSLHQASMVTSLGPGREVKSLIPTEHFPFPGNFSFLADFVTEGFKHFHTKCQKQHQLMQGCFPFELRTTHSVLGHILDLCRGHKRHRHIAEGMGQRGGGSKTRILSSNTAPKVVLFLPGKHPHTHQIFSKALKWFQCYTTKGITDSLKESISPLPKFTQPKAWAANNKDRWRRNTSPLGSSTALRHFPGEFHEHVGGAAASPCHPQCVEHRLQPFPSEQCYWERGEQLPI